jgi:hypothetical protein
VATWQCGFWCTARRYDDSIGLYDISLLMKQSPEEYLAAFRWMWHCQKKKKFHDFFPLPVFASLSAQQEREREDEIFTLGTAQHGLNGGGVRIL